MRPTARNTRARHTTLTTEALKRAVLLGIAAVDDERANALLLLLLLLIVAIV